MDIYKKRKRSEIMAGIRSKDTLPELEVQSLLDELGHKYETHVNGLPGKPDIVLRKSKLVIFIHGCFWHHHDGCNKGTFPKTRKEFWRKKILANVDRDKLHISKLNDLGWRVLILWECEVKQGLAKTKLLDELFNA
jgi:DNA mismatch endonuclease (patch repair protein)